MQLSKFLCVLGVGVGRCILDNFISFNMEEIIYTTQLLNHESLLISGIKLDMSFVHHTLLNLANSGQETSNKLFFFPLFLLGFLLLHLPC